MSKYDAIGVFLSQQPLELTQLELTIDEFEKKTGCALPPVARARREWWANTLQNRNARSWLQAGWKVKIHPQEKRVTFFRADGINPGLTTKARSGAYEGLEAFLRTLPVDQYQIAMSVDELDAVMGRPLPKTARIDRTWWANARKSNHARYWLNAGWRVDQVYLRSKIVVFRRPRSDISRLIHRQISAVLDGSRVPERISAEKTAECIAFCRRVAWYFEGTILYERVNADFGSLSEPEIVRLEEDYQVCKRELNRYKNMQLLQDHAG
jgi:hypothetical protein